MNGQSLNNLMPLTAGQAPNPGHAGSYPQENLIAYLLRLKDELLWPRILVRSAPPPDEI